MRKIKTLDLKTKIPLNKTCLIEASAGTGKTFSITNIFLQAVLDGLTIDKILVVTFTTAATKELRSRIRSNLYDALACIRTGEDRNNEVIAAVLGDLSDGATKDKNIKLLVAPVINQKATYHAYIITQKDSKIKGFSDFENKSFAFTDPLSTTGRLYPLQLLKRRMKNEEDFFLKTIYTYGHDISIQMVNRGIIDGASVHGLIYDYIALHHPERVENIKIIDKSVKFGIPPVVTPTTLDQDDFMAYRNIFMDISNDSIGRVILDNLNIDKYQVVGDTLYRSVFQLKEYTDNVAKK